MVGDLLDIPSHNNDLLRQASVAAKDKRLTCLAYLCVRRRIKELSAN